MIRPIETVLAECRERLKKWREAWDSNPGGGTFAFDEATSRTEAVTVYMTLDAFPALLEVAEEILIEQEKHRDKFSCWRNDAERMVGLAARLLRVATEEAASPERAQ